MRCGSVAVCPGRGLDHPHQEPSALRLARSCRQRRPRHLRQLPQAPRGRHARQVRPRQLGERSPRAPGASSTYLSLSASSRRTQADQRSLLPQEKVRKVLDIWTKASTFSSSAMARVSQKLLAAGSSSSKPARVASPARPSLSPGAFPSLSSSRSSGRRARVLAKHIRRAHRRRCLGGSTCTSCSSRGGAQRPASRRSVATLVSRPQPQCSRMPSSSRARSTSMTQTS